MISKLFDVLTTAFGPLGPVYALAAVAAFLIAMAAPVLLKKRIDPIDKLGKPRHNLAGAKDRQRLRHGNQKHLEALAPFLEPKDKEQLGAIRKKLLQAGYRSQSAVRTFYFSRGLLALGLMSVAVVVLSIRGDDVGLRTYLIACGAMLGIGYLAPNYWVTRRIQSRQEQIKNGFPDALDLMLVCVEAGQSLDQSLQRVSVDVMHAHPALGEELEIVAHESRAGKDRALVLREFADRSGVNDVASFVTVLIQSAQFGTSVADALRVYAAEMRDKRLLRAEEKANVLPTKLTLGTMFFTVPPLILILIGPSLVDIINALSGMAGKR
jgi:tight adherence protein C